eukprot:6187136-Pleurochrysis_carterae.AAC.4
MLSLSTGLVDRMGDAGPRYTSSTLARCGEMRSTGALVQRKRLAESTKPETAARLAAIIEHEVRATQLVLDHLEA